MRDAYHTAPSRDVRWRRAISPSRFSRSARAQAQAEESSGAAAATLRALKEELLAARAATDSVAKRGNATAATLREEVEGPS